MSFSQASFLSLSSGGFHRNAYLDWGKPASSQVVVCVHGLSRNSRDFDYLARDLARDCRVICPDVVGRGDSEWLADKGDYSFSTYLSDAASLIARITAPAPPVTLGTVRRLRGSGQGPATIDWVGTSMGGLIGMLLAAKRGSPIRRLVLNDIGAFISWGSLYRLKGYVAGGGSFRDLAEVEAYLRDACAPFGPLTDEQWRHLAEHSAARVGDGPNSALYRMRYDPAIGDTMRVSAPDPEFPLGPNFLAGIDLWKTWTEIRCPTLVLRGAESDVLSHETLMRMQALRPGVEVLELPGIGHAPALMSYDQIAAVREFLLR
ncbi:MAG TPA: alpha/beta hydrolase [Burkholderiales bacterium]|nr:alpha/beta hydrolase [Burkholderiales bacterium]